MTRRERPWILTQASAFTRAGLWILAWVYDWQHRKDERNGS